MTMKKSAGTVFVALLFAWLYGPHVVYGATPTLTQSFKSTSGKTVIAYFDYDSGPCGTSVSCNFRGPIRVPRGFDQVEVFLSGFKLETATQSDAVHTVIVTVNKYTYDPATGALEVGVSGSFTTRSSQNYSYKVSFVVILASASVAKFSRISGGCGGVDSCRIIRSLPAAVPPGMKYIGLATQNWHIGSNRPVLLNTISGHQDGLTVSPPSVNIEYLCVMHGARIGSNKMFCEWGASVIAFDPAEMEQNGSSLFPQYTFVSWGTTTRQAWSEYTPAPSHNPIAGYLSAFEGATYTYQTFPYTSNVQYPIWTIEASAANFRISPSAPDTSVTDYGIFLGTAFANTSTAKKFAYQESRAVGLLK